MTATAPPGGMPSGTPGLSGDERRGRAVGASVLAVFAFAWTAWGLSAAAASAVRRPMLGAAALASLALVLGATSVFRRATSTPSGEPATRPATGPRFGLVAGLQFAAIPVGSLLLARVGHSRVIPAFICFVVGLHFFPLRRLFGVTFYARTGTALCLVAFTTVLLAPLTGHPTLWTMIPGLGAAATLYATGAVLVLAKR